LFSPNPANGAKVTPKQQRLLSRLNEIGLQVLRNEPGGQTPSIEKELDYLEQALNAPESQSRAPAELADSGLFIDDEVEESKLSEDYKQAEYEEGILRERKKQEGREVLSRIGRATEQLRNRYEDLKVRRTLQNNIYECY
jgi:Skp family chaperone for outer membrane proteins